jgi:hypothetical protein
MLAEENKLKKVIKSTLGKSSRSPTITVVETAEGGYETDPQKIHNHLTAGWQGAFSQ